MPISYRIDEDRKRIYTRAEGMITYAELREHINEDIDESAATFGELFDCSSATTNITPDEIRDLAAERLHIAKLKQAGPAAVVATNNVLFGMLRMYDILTGTARPIRVFRDRQEAEEWLDEIAR